MCYACFRGSFISSRLRGVCCCCCLVVKSWPTLCDPMEYSPPGSSCLWDFPGKNTGVGCHFLFQGIFLTRRVVWWAQNIFLCPVSMQPHLTIFCISLIFTSQREKRVALCGSETWQNPGISVCPLATLVPPFSPSRLLSEEATFGFLSKVIVTCGKAQVFHLLFKLNDSEHFDEGHGFSWIPFIVQSDLPFSHLQCHRTVRSPQS